jgi:hypothetical protein
VNIRFNVYFKPKQGYAELYQFLDYNDAWRYFHLRKRFELFCQRPYTIVLARTSDQKILIEYTLSDKTKQIVPGTKLWIRTN